MDQVRSLDLSSLASSDLLPLQSKAFERERERDITALEPSDRDSKVVENCGSDEEDSDRNRRDYEEDNDQTMEVTKNTNFGGFGDGESTNRNRNPSRVTTMGFTKKPLISENFFQITYTSKSKSKWHKSMRTLTLISGFDCLTYKSSPNF